MWIPRLVESLIVRLAAQRPAVVVTGARQTGKTALVQRLFPGHAYVSLDLPSEAAQAERDPNGFLARHPPPVVVDEVQYAPGLFRHLKSSIDRQRDRAGLFVLTGSQAFGLMRSVSDSLAGRAAVVALETLSYAEARGALPDLSPEQFLLRGGFPELYQKPEMEASGFYRSYLATYLERDVRQALQVSSLRDFERFVRSCALRTAQLLNRSDLARDVGVSGSTAGAWLSVLEASTQVALLEPWYSNRTKSLVKTPKLYLADSGLAAFLCGVHDMDDLLAGPLAGALWETLVFAEIRKRQEARDGGWSLDFWRDRSKEADFLSHRGGRFALADAKWSSEPDARDAAPLSRVAAELEPGSVASMSLICRCRNPFPVASGVQAVPLLDLPAALL